MCMLVRQVPPLRLPALRRCLARCCCSRWFSCSHSPYKKIIQVIYKQYITIKYMWHLRVLQLLVLVACSNAQTGNGVTSKCAQQTLCGPGCVNTLQNGICYQCGAYFWKTTTSAGTCSACSANTGVSCTMCTADTDCSCNIGYWSTTGKGPCTACVAGKYSGGSGGLTVDCFFCPAGTTSPIASGYSTDCVSNTGNGVTTGCTQAASCPTGCYGTGNAICYQCGTGFYKAIAGTSLCLACASNSGSSCSVCTAAASCPCNVGYTGPNGGVCTACVAGKYKIATGTAACTDCAAGTYSATVGATVAATCLACPTSSSSPISSVALTACICNVGFTGPLGGPCTTCVAGKYKIITGTAACTDCAAGTFSATVGATVATTCLGCPTSSSSPISSSALAACTCNVGFAGLNGGTCTACVAGTYKDTTGSVACTTCPTSSSSPSTSVALTACTCNLGYTGPNGGVCAACVAGKYKIITGTALCTDCAVATYSTAVAATVAATCLACPTSSNSPIASSAQPACTCNTGFSGPDGGTCTACVAGTYKDTTGSVACTTCPTASNSPSTSVALTACACSPAYTGPLGGPCTACVAGKYKASTGTLACSSCPVGKYSVVVAAITSINCTNCGVGNFCNTTAMATASTCPANSGDSCATCATVYCPCNAGYTGGNFISPYSTTACARFIALMPTPSLASVSTRLSPGVGILPTYNATGGPYGKGHVSFNRATLQYLDGGTRTLNIATNGGFSLVTVVRFTGTAGKYESLFNLGTVKNTNNIILCRDTSLTDFALYGSNTAISISDSTFYWVPGSLAQNQWLTVEFKYKASSTIYYVRVNNVAISSGAASTAITDRTTNVYVAKPWSTTDNIYFNGDIAGLFFVDEYLTDDATTAIGTSLTQGFDLTDTTCPAGNACTACDAAKYKSTSGTASCTDCTVGMTSPSASTSNTACILAYCNAGYTGPAGSCTACVAGKYKNDTGSAACSDCAAGTYSTTVGATVATTCIGCPTSSNSPISSAVLAACTCNVGFTGPDGGVCVLCVAGKYKPATGNATCTDCAAGTYSTTLGATVATTCIGCPTSSNSPISSAVLAACTCNVGFTGPDGGTCTACAAGKYKTATGSMTCTDCGVGTYSTATGASAVALCTACAAGTFSATVAATVAASCLACPISSNSPISSSAIAACTCNVGFTGPDGSACTACAARTYKATSGSVNCTTCPVNSGSTCSACVMTSACRCDAGYKGGNFIAPYSITACDRFMALIVWNPSFASVSTRLSAAVGTIPTYNSTGGPYAKGHVNFVRTSSQYLTGASNSWKFATNGGVTVVAVVNFYGTPGSNENLLNCGQAAGWYNLFIGRYDVSEEFGIGLMNGGTYLVWLVTSGSVLKQDKWLTLVYKYRASTKAYEFSVNGISFSGVSTSAAATDRTTTCYVGRSWWSSHQYLNANVAGLLLVDEVLNTDATDAIASAMVNGVDLTDTTCPAGNNCTACIAGTYTNALDAATCVACPAHSNSPLASSAVAACTCNVGFTGPNGDVCTACVAGKYKIATGSAACSDCGAGTVSTTVGATAAAACLACPTSSNSPSSSSALAACTCNVGFSGPDGTGPCAACVAGKYKIATGSAACSDCGAGTVSTTVGATAAATCLPCAVGTYTTTGLPPSCTDNVNVLWSTENGDFYCSSLSGGNTFSTIDCVDMSWCQTCCVTCASVCGTTTTTTCAACPTSSSSPISSSALTACTCNVGFTGPNGGACTTCVAGTYKTTAGSATCTACAAGKYSATTGATAAATCLACPPGSASSVSSSSSFSCVCNAGYTGPDGICSTCAAGLYKTTTGSDTCVACVAGTYSTVPAATTATTCVACPAGSSSPSQSQAATACTCKAGYSGADGGPCGACSAGSYKNATGSAACTSCPAFSSASCASCTDALSCICTAYTGGICTACVAASAPASTGAGACVCGPGRYDALVF